MNEVSSSPTLLREDALDVRFMFPTPVLIATLDNHDAINGDLRQRILARAETHPSVSYSNSGGWQSEADTLSWTGPSGEAVLSAGHRLGNMITAVNGPDGLKRIEIPWRINAWANLNRAGNANEMHTHAGSYWSGVYYVDDGADGAKQTGGELEFLDPRGVAPLMYAPHLKATVQSCATAGLSEFHSPRSGQLVLFPAWMFHGVRPYRGSGTRISIAFNLCL